jgi:hypothetical protein
MRRPVTTEWLKCGAVARHEGLTAYLNRLSAQEYAPISGPAYILGRATQLI